MRKLWSACAVTIAVTAGAVSATGGTQASSAAVTGSMTASYLKTLAGPSQAQMYPSGLIWDANRKVIVVADTGFNRITVFNPTGPTPQVPIETFGSYGTGNGQFDTPRDVAVDAQSNIYVADAANSRIQAFKSDGTWLWTAGGPGKTSANLNVPIGISYDFSNNQVIVADTGHSLVKAYSTTGAYLWKSANAGLASPRQARLGPDGRIWVADYHHQEVKAFDFSVSGALATFTLKLTLGDGLNGGHNVGELNAPYNVAFSPDSKTVYVADTGNERISRWTVSLTGSNPTATAIPAFGSRCANPCPAPPGNISNFVQLRRVTVDPATGDIWAADFWGSGIHGFRSSGTAYFEIAGAEAPTPGFAEAYGVSISPTDGSVYGVDRLNQRIEHLNQSTGANLNTVGMRGVAAGQFSWPETAGVAPDGTVWVGDTRNDRLQHFTATLSGKPAIVGASGTAVGQFSYIEGVSVDSQGIVWVADSNNNRIQSYSPATLRFTAFGSLGAGQGQVRNPEGVVAAAGDLYVADTMNNRVEELNRSTGAYVAEFDGLNQPQGIALSPDGSLWVADTMNNRIVHLSATLTDLGNTFGSPGNGTMQFFQPHSLAISADNKTLIVADTYNNRLQEFSLTAS